MRKKLFTLLLAVAASVGTMFAWDYEHVQIGDLYYNLDATNQTAEVARNSSASGEIIIPSSVTYNSVIYSVTSIGSGAFDDCSGLKSLTIPNSVTSIGDAAFYGCSGLTSVTIPNSVTSIGNMAFAWCSGLTSINVASDNSYYCSVDSVLFNKDKTTLIQYPGGKQGAYTIPNSVTRIGSDAFGDCISLTSVTIPNSVTSIGDGAFSGCTGLTSVTIPNSVTSIGWNAFYGCSGLTSITCEAITPPTLDDGVFYHVDKSIPLYVPAGSISAYQSADVWKDFTDILPISQQGLEDVQGNNLQCTKVVRDGLIFILRGDKTYTTEGRLVR